MAYELWIQVDLIDEEGDVFFTHLIQDTSDDIFTQADIDRVAQIALGQLLSGPQYEQLRDWLGQNNWRINITPWDVLQT